MPLSLSLSPSPSLPHGHMLPGSTGTPQSCYVLIQPCWWYEVPWDLALGMHGAAVAFWERAHRCRQVVMGSFHPPGRTKVAHAEILLLRSHFPFFHISLKKIGLCPALTELSCPSSS